MSDGIQSFYESAVSQGAPRQASGDYAVIPADASIVPLEAYQDRPRRVRQSFKAETLASLADYINWFKMDSTKIFASVVNRQIRAVIDHHDNQEAARHCDHVALYSPPLAEEWERWTEISGRYMEQAAFASFLEENQPDIVTPDGASLIELARSLKATRKIDFASEIDEADGTVKLRYQETTEQASGGRQEIAVPKSLELGIPVFFGGEKYKVVTWFRYRVTDDKRLKFAVELHRQKYILQDAFMQMVQAVGVDTEIEPLIGHL